MPDEGTKANFTRVARPLEPVLDLSVAVPARAVDYSIRRRAVEPVLDLSATKTISEATDGLQEMSTPELLVLLKANRKPTRELLIQIHEIAVDRLRNEASESSSEGAVELSRAAMATALEFSQQS